MNPMGSGLLDRDKLTLKLEVGSTWISDPIAGSVHQPTAMTDTGCLRVGQKAPDFTATAVVDQEFKEISLSQYRGKYVVLFFYPLDFTFVCPTEITAFSDRYADFSSKNTEVLGVLSTASSATWPGSRPP